MKNYFDYLSNFILDDIPTVGSRINELQVASRRKNGLDVLAIKGAPAEPLPTHILESHVISPTEATYAPSRGIPELQSAIAHLIGVQTGLTLDPSRQILITNGAMQGLYVTMMTLLNPSDEVIIPSPCFFFHDVVRLAGGNPITVPMSEEGNWQINLKKLENAITPHTKAMLINTPVNPTGYVYSRELLSELYDLAEQRDIILIADEAYERYVYDDRLHSSILEIPGASNRTILIRSFTKSYSLGPWRIGYIVAPQAIIDVASKVTQWMNLSVNYISQKTALSALTGPQDWLSHLNKAWEANRDVLYEAVSQMKLVYCVKPQGGPFIFLNIKRLEKSEGDLAEYLLDDWGIPTTQGMYFDSPGYLRIPFGGTPETIKELAERLDGAVNR